MLFISAAEKVRDERQWQRLLRDRVWRDDYIWRKFDECCPDCVPGDILGLRRLFDMEPFPGLVEDDNWDVLWALFLKWPFLLVFMIGYFQRKQRTPRPLVRSNSF
ncbi:U2 [Hyposoter didymator ichnovirus]|nr:U2 [Hyposoter didymator ichnovirus]